MAFGIPADSILQMWDWVGGRYSLWSSVGVSAALAIGMLHFREMLEGASAMDEHFRTAPLDRNLPVTLGLLGVWYNNFLGTRTHCVVPYEESLRYLVDHLQQLDMEKRVTRNGEFVGHDTGAILWGGTGTSTQHAFFQLLHQGTHRVSMDFLMGLEPICEDDGRHRLLVANCIPL